MTQYQVVARKYRPKNFCEVMGQNVVVATLKNAMKSQRLAHAYLFCGPRGTGKTTLARILAKALNCSNRSKDQEPCNQCSSCKEIASGSSLDVLEIDGASHRGIDDVRQINETVGYAASSGKYKIYIIDEVHMLTKEAFNALLKTLEEPPENVKFLFATTEPHKVIPTILSRCQRFNLNRIPLETIVHKLQMISNDLEIQAEEGALRLIAKRAEGGLRDAESLFDQIIVFQDGSIDTETVTSILGIVGNEILFELDKAGKEGQFSFAFEIANQVFSQGKDFIHFVESLVEHFRNLLLVKLSNKNVPFLALSELERDKYEISSNFYTKEQCFNLIEYLIEQQNKIRFSPSPKIALEAILLHIMRIHHRIPVEYLVKRLVELEEKVQTHPSDLPEKLRSKLLEKPAETIPTPQPRQEKQRICDAQVIETKTTEIQNRSNSSPIINPEKASLTQDKNPSSALIQTAPKLQAKNEMAHSVSIDPHPTSSDLGLKKSEEIKNKPLPQKPTKIPKELQRRYDTILHFAAVELEGIVQKGQ